VGSAWKRPWALIAGTFLRIRNLSRRKSGRASPSSQQRAQVSQGTPGSEVEEISRGHLQGGHRDIGCARGPAKGRRAQGCCYEVRVQTSLTSGRPQRHWRRLPEAWRLRDPPSAGPSRAPRPRRARPLGLQGSRSATALAWRLLLRRPASRREWAPPWAAAGAGASGLECMLRPWNRQRSIPSSGRYSC